MIVGIIQARMGSTRLPGKIMLEVAGKSMLEHMIERISLSKKMDKIIVATTKNKIDDVIEKICKKNKIQYLRGSEQDVLSRFKDAADITNASTIVRLGADSPLLDATIIDDVIDCYEKNHYDYVSNLFPRPATYPDGVMVEVFSSKILENADKNAKKPSEREHVTFYIWMQPKKFKIHRVDFKIDLSKYRFNLDYKEDYELIKKIFENLLPIKKFFQMNDIIEWLKKNPQVFEINSHIEALQGWKNSFKEDKQAGF